jgi:hypothetical protein
MNGLGKIWDSNWSIYRVIKPSKTSKPSPVVSFSKIRIELNGLGKIGDRLLLVFLRYVAPPLRTKTLFLNTKMGTPTEIVDISKARVRSIA